MHYAATRGAAVCAGLDTLGLVPRAWYAGTQC